MKDQLVRKPLLVRKSAVHGYGVFAESDIAANEVIEECYVILTQGGDKGLKNYYFNGSEIFKWAIPIGLGFVYNHANQPNADYYLDEENNLLVFTTTQFIPAGEEIFISYGKDWFAKRKMVIKPLPFWRKVKRFVLGMLLRAGIVVGGIYFLIYWLKLIEKA